MNIEKGQRVWVKYNYVTRGEYWGTVISTRITSQGQDLLWIQKDGKHTSGVYERYEVMTKKEKLAWDKEQAQKELERTKKKHTVRKQNLGILAIGMFLIWIVLDLWVF